MRVVVQRSLNASVEINGKVNGKIDSGYVLLIGFTHDDTYDVIDKMIEKIVNLRIFEDEDNKMNNDITKVNGSILSISQFTLYAKLNGRRPSFTDAMKYDDALKMYEYFNQKLESKGFNVQKGIFGSDMKVKLVNDGPVTIIIDSKEDF